MTEMIPQGPMAAVAIVTVVALALGLARSRIRHVGYEASRDARLAGEVRDEIVQGRIPEARDRLRRASGPLARVLLAVFRFPYGVHREAVEMGWAEAVSFERREHPDGGTPLPILAGLGLALGVASDVAHGAASPFSGTPTLLGALGACVTVGLWARLRRLARQSGERLESASGEIARLIIEFTESPQIVRSAHGQDGGSLAAVESAASQGVNRPEVLHP